MLSRGWLFLLAGLAGCTADPHTASIRLTFADATRRAQAVSVVLETRTGGCTGPAAFVDLVLPSGSMGSERRLDKGTYGFDAEARDATCQTIAHECVEVSLPKDGTIEIVLANVAPAFACIGGTTC